MFSISEYTVEYLKDPFGIIDGDRYEFFIYIDVSEEDELYQDSGVHVKVLYAVTDGIGDIIKYDLIENETNKILDFELEEEEEKMIADFCATHTSKEEE